MKKLLLCLMLLVCFGTARSQVLFFEDFDGLDGPTAGGAGTYVFPPGWLLRNVDNRTPNAQVAYVNEAWERREDFAGNVADSVAFSTSWYAPVGAANDWMWTPLVGPLPANSQLKWSAKAYDTDFRDGYEVRIMTGTPPTGGTGVIGNQITNSTVLFSTAGENAAWTDHEQSLGAYAGQSVYIGFRNNSNDKFILVINNVKIEVVNNHDAQLLSKDTLTEYTGIPLSQVKPLPFKASIKNSGLMGLTNVRLNIQVSHDQQIVYADSSLPASLASGNSAGFTVAPYTPAAVGTYGVKYFVSSAEADVIHTNDTLYDSFIITDSTYARDKGAVTGSLGIGAGTGGYLGQDYELVNADDLTSVDVAYTRGYAGKRCAAVIWNMSAGKPSTIVATTDTLLYQDDSARMYRFRIHGGSVNLLPGRYAVTAVEFDSTLAVAQTAELFTKGRTWVNWPGSPLGGWANNEAFGASFSKSYMIRPNFGVLCSISSMLDSSHNLSCHGSNDGYIALATTGASGAVTYHWSPDVSTTSSAADLAAGMYSITVTDAAGCSSVVHVELTEPAPLNVNTSLAGSTITAAATGVNYQWINCNGNVPVQGANGKTFTPSQTGSYAVIISDGSCTDTSACVAVTLVGINEQLAENLFAAYPNPNNGKFTVKSATDGNYTIYNSLGQVIRTFTLNAKNNHTMQINDLAPGAYTISGETGAKLISQKLVVTK